jgi:hypothetical protein
MPVSRHPVDGQEAATGSSSGFTPVFVTIHASRITVMSRMIWTLGLAGVLPFAAGVLAPLLPDGWQPRTLELTLLYAALLLAFLGGTHWGFALYAEEAPQMRLVLAVLPPLYALGMLQLPRPAAALALAAGFAAVFALDSWLARRGLHHPDYWRLRQILTAVACLALTAVALQP